jgi:hypothetical protein
VLALSVAALLGGSRPGAGVSATITIGAIGARSAATRCIGPPRATCSRTATYQPYGYYQAPPPVVYVPPPSPGISLFFGFPHR